MPDEPTTWLEDFVFNAIIIVALLAMLPIVAVVFLTGLAAMIAMAPVVLIWWIAQALQGRI